VANISGRLVVVAKEWWLMVVAERLSGGIGGMWLGFLGLELFLLFFFRVKSDVEGRRKRKERKREWLRLIDSNTKFDVGHSESNSHSEKIHTKTLK